MKIHDLPLEKVKVNPRNPRTDYGNLDDLVTSIEMYGVLQPIVAAPSNGGWVAVAGSRRLKAAKLAGLTEIPAVIRDVPRRTQDEIALTENIVRLEMSPVEEALAYSKLLKERGITQKQLAEILGVKPHRISNRIVLLRLPKDRLQLVHDGVITVVQALDESRAIRDGVPVGMRQKKAPRGQAVTLHMLSGHARCRPESCEVKAAWFDDIATGRHLG